MTASVAIVALNIKRKEKKNLAESDSRLYNTHPMELSNFNYSKVCKVALRAAILGPAFKQVHGGSESGNSGQNRMDNRPILGNQNEEES